MSEQMDIFSSFCVPFKFSRKKVTHIIELFGGIGCQARALERMGIPFYSTLVEIDKYAVKSYNAIHGTDFETKDICQVHASDLGIKADEQNILFYSFPCTDISQAGLQKGITEETRSGLLFEVQRLLGECGGVVSHKFA